MAFKKKKKHTLFAFDEPVSLCVFSQCPAPLDSWAKGGTLPDTAPLHDEEAITRGPTAAGGGPDKKHERFWR